MSSKDHVLSFNLDVRVKNSTLAIAVGSIASGWALFTIIKKIREYNILNNNRQRTFEKRDEVKKRLEELANRLEENGILVTPERERILNLPIEELLKDLQDGKLTAVNVLRAFQAKAIEATRKYNCITEFVWEAETWAEELDRVTNRGPLHGLPVSIKDSICIAGYDSTLGIPSRLGNPASENAVVVETWKQAGAIPFCHTNLPQTTYSYESSNPIWGTTLNPRDPTRSPGGSSSGEAALICAGGSLLGIGTDLGGSVRIPAQFCGIASLRPTHMRFSPQGKVEPMPGLCGVTSVPGVMGRDVTCVVTGARALLNSDVMRKLDTEVVPVPWRDEIFSSTRVLRIGYYTTLDASPSSPGCRRAVVEACQALERRGHTLIPFQFTTGEPEIRLFLNIAASDGYRQVNNILKDDIWDSCLKDLRQPNPMTNMYRIFMQWLSNLKRPEKQRQYFGYPGVYEYQMDLASRKLLIEHTLQAWDKANVDVVLGPTLPFTALKLNAEFKSVPLVYTFMCNLLEQPAGVVPVTTESKEDLGKVEEPSAGAKGLPITAMILGRPWQEELVLRVMKDLESEISK